jgi:hypothetical protein
MSNIDKQKNVNTSKRVIKKVYDEEAVRNMPNSRY